MSILLIIGAGICFVMFIMFNYAFNNADTGLFVKLNESAQKTMNADTRSWFVNLTGHIQTGFGMSGVILMGLGIFVAVANSFKTRRLE